MNTLRVLISEPANEYARQVLIEEQFHADVARRCSRIAANARAARTWSVVNSGKSATISSVVISNAKYSNTSDRDTRADDARLASANIRSHIDQRDQVHSPILVALRWQK